MPMFERPEEGLLMHSWDCLNDSFQSWIECRELVKWPLSSPIVSPVDYSLCALKKGRHQLPRENQRQIIPDKASQTHVEGLVEMCEYIIFITILTLLASEWPYPLNRSYTCHGWHVTNVTETVIYCYIKKPFVVYTDLAFQTLQPFCVFTPLFPW